MSRVLDIYRYSAVLAGAAALCAAGLGSARLAAAQSRGDSEPSSRVVDAARPGARERLVLFNVAFYGRGANSVEPGDSAIGPVTTTRLRAQLEKLGRFELIDSARVANAVAAAERNGVSCNTLECRRDVSRQLGAKWMVTAKFSKLSNLIWYLSGQLTEVSSGRRLLDDEFELKGMVDDMSRGGAISLARRIVKAADRATTAAAAP